MKEKIEELIALYELRLKAKSALERCHGKEKAAGILYELQSVIKDLQVLLKEHTRPETLNDWEDTSKQYQP